MLKRVNFDILNQLFLPVALIFIALSVVFKNQAIIQVELLMSVVFLYVLFAMVHHYFDKSLTIETALEYILIAVLSLVVLTGSVV